MREYAPGLRTVVADIDRLGVARRRALRARLATVVDTLDPEGGPERGADPGSTRALVEAVLELVDPRRADQLWLLLAVVTARIPDPERLAEAHRRVLLDGVLPTLGRALPHLPPGGPPRPWAWPSVEVMAGRVLVDVSDTAATPHATGIQRVTRATARRWARDHDVVLVGWDARGVALRPLPPEQTKRLLAGVPARATTAPTADVVVPWGGTYLLPELATESPRTAGLRSIATWAGARTGMIGFDCVPLTTAETVGPGMGGGFALMLAAAAEMDRVVAISEAAAAEYRGWRRMLAGAGRTGPEVDAVGLATEAVAATPEMQRAARELLGDTTGRPVVLAVGSHEPRKNHLAVLHAAELLWRRGAAFEVVFVGGRGWRSDRFFAEVERLRIAGRPVTVLTGVDDDCLWGLYRVATVVVFPSLNEGFGLPICEALANGTPVVTSAFGSMAEVAAAGGCVLVDPRDDRSIAQGVALVLDDPAVRDRLVAEAAARPTVSWDDYAARTWDRLAGAGSLVAG